MDSENWVQVGNLKKRRQHHAVEFVDVNDFECKSKELSSSPTKQPKKKTTQGNF